MEACETPPLRTQSKAEVRLHTEGAYEHIPIDEPRDFAFEMKRMPCTARTRRRHNVVLGYCSSPRKELMCLALGLQSAYGGDRGNLGQLQDIQLAASI